MVLNILHKPMVTDIIIPLIGLALLIGWLSWASIVRRRDPVEHHHHKHPERI